MDRKHKWEGRFSLAQRVVATLALLVALGALGSTFQSFGAYGEVGCGPPIHGTKVEHRAPATSFLDGREAAVCQSNGHSRLAVAGVVGVLALVVGIAGWLRPLGLPWWATGDDPPWLAERRREDAHDHMDDPATEPLVPAESVPPAPAPPGAPDGGVEAAPTPRSPTRSNARIRQARERAAGPRQVGAPRPRPAARPANHLKPVAEPPSTSPKRPVKRPPDKQGGGRG